MLLRGGPSGPNVFSGDGSIIFVENPFAPDIRAVGTVRQLGFDQVEEGYTFIDSVMRLQVPRENSLSDPLQVVLGPVLAGSLIEIDWRATLQATSSDAEDSTFDALPLISFLPAPTFPADFQVLNNGFSAALSPLDGVGGVDHIYSFTGLAAFVVPADAAQCVIQLGYTATELVVGSADWSVGGIDGKNFPLAMTLKATEYAAGRVAQAGPGVLV